MKNAILRTLSFLLELQFPPTGRHRLISTPAAPPLPPAPTAPRVRPYVLAHEDRLRHRAQRQRRRALWLAVHGIDIGPRVLHGVEVA